MLFNEIATNLGYANQKVKIDSDRKNRSKIVKLTLTRIFALRNWYNSDVPKIIWEFKVYTFINVEGRYFIPIHLPSFIRRPLRDIGMPVFFDTRLFALVTPSARFHENDKPGPSFIQPPESTPT